MRVIEALDLVPEGIDLLGAVLLDLLNAGTLIDELALEVDGHEQLARFEVVDLLALPRGVGVEDLKILAVVHGLIVNGEVVGDRLAGVAAVEAVELLEDIKAFNDVLKPLGIKKCGIRLDSGDIAYLSRKARKMLDEAGWENCTITVSNSLDEYLIQDLWMQDAKIDAFGVGERLITAKSEPVFGCVYKLVAVEDKDGNVIPKIKISENVGKITNPHFKKLYRFFGNDTGKAIADYLCVYDETVDDSKDLEIFDPSATWKRKTVYDFTAKELMVQVFRNGELVYDLPPLKDIQKIVENPAFDRQKALEQQITLLTLKKQHLEDLIGLAQKIRSTGGMVMDFTAFDTQKIKKYTEQAKKEWGETPEYKEFEEKTAHKTEKEVKDMSSQLMDIVAAFGGMQSKDPADPEVQAQVKKLQEFITEHYYNCSKVILNQLGQMYGAGGAFTENINAAGGAGAAEFAQKAIEIYCK